MRVALPSRAMTTSRPDRVLHFRMAAWACCVAAAVGVAALPGDPGTIPVGWLVVLGLLALGAARGSTVARAVLVGLNGALLATAALLAPPVAGTLWGFYGLVAMGLVVLVVPAGTRSRVAH